MLKDLCAITTCMGRLQFLTQTCVHTMAQMPLCVVDYSCPDRCGEWLRQHHPECMVEVVAGETYFNKPRAQNRGAARAIAEGFEYLCFADADTILKPGFAAYIRAHLNPNTFWIANDEHLDLFGMLVAPAAAFSQVNGYDEQFDTWGSEDFDMRLRLRLIAKLDFLEIPSEYLDFMTHDDNLRMANYTLKDRALSSRQTNRKLALKLGEISIAPGTGERPDVKRLLGIKPDKS
jgi:hypothetical protein